MSQIKKKFLASNSVDEAKIRLSNDGAFRARNAADSADISLFKLDASNVLQFLQLPRVATGPSNQADLVRKKYVDDEVAVVQGEVDAVEGRVTTIENKIGAANGIAELDANGKVPSNQLPSYVDDVLEYANLAAFPVSGSQGIIYVALDTKKIYRWSGSTYIEISPSEVTSVNSQSGAVVLESDDISLSASIRSASHVQGALSALDTDLATAEGDITDLQSDVGGLDSRLTTAEGEIDTLQSDYTALDGRVGTAESDITALEGRASALEAASVEFKAVEKFILSGTDISNGYVELSYQAITNSIHAFVDRLAIHAGDDYTVSVVAGKTRLTFAGALLADEALVAGDIVRVKAAKVAI